MLKMLADGERAGAETTRKPSSERPRGLPAPRKG
jgi:hypothetical protein